MTACLGLIQYQTILRLRLVDMLGVVVVNKKPQAVPFQHGGAFLRAAFFGVKRNNAPRRQIGPGEQPAAKIGGPARARTRASQNKRGGQPNPNLRPDTH
jgi:hypothetical protein